MTISHRADVWEAQNGVGDYWWLSLLKALTGAGKDDKTGEAPIDHSKVRWL